jgi:hypothetical protein
LNKEKVEENEIEVIDSDPYTKDIFEVTWKLKIDKMKQRALKESRVLEKSSKIRP